MKKGYKEIEVNLDDKTLLALALEAHKRDITINKLVENYMKDFLEKTKHMSKKEFKALLNGEKNANNADNNADNKE